MNALTEFFKNPDAFDDDDDVGIILLRDEDDEESPHRQPRRRVGGLNFFNKAYISEYEANTAEFQIKTWSELCAQLDLSYVKDKDYRVVQTLEELKELSKEFFQARIVALDTETTGLNIFNMKWSDYRKDVIVGMSITWKENQGIYIPFLHEKFPNLPLRETLEFLKPWLEKVPSVLHNAIFDYKVFFDLGIRLNVAHDTMSMIFHMDSRTAHGGKALKGIIKRIFGTDTFDLEELTGSKRFAGLFRKVELDVARVYACADTDYAFTLFTYLIKVFDKRQLGPYLQDIKLIPIIARSEYYGKPINMKRARELNAVNNKDIEVLKNLLFEYVGTFMNLQRGIREKGYYVFNVNSTPELCTVMYNILGYEIKQYSDTTGLPAFNSSVMKALIKEKPISRDEVLDIILQGDLLSAVCDYVEDAPEEDRILLKESKLRETRNPAVVIMKKLRALVKLKSSFFGKLLNDSSDGVWYTSISITATETSRLVDVAQTLASYMRILIEPHDLANWAMADADYAQIEARCMAGFGNVKGEMNDLVQNLNHCESDYHRVAGADMYNTTPEDMTDDQRHGVKAANFGIPFAMSAKGLTNFRYGIILDEALAAKRLLETTLLLENWNQHNAPIKAYLDSYRNAALTVCMDNRLLEYLDGEIVSKIYNHRGRARVFKLTGIISPTGEVLDREAASTIFRQAGNFPIQSFARDIYGDGVLGVWGQFEKAGLTDIIVEDSESPMGYRFEQKVYIVAYVHDEILIMWHKDINVRFIVKVLSKYFMQHIDGFPNFYTGINIVTNWYEGKMSKYECPVAFSEEFSKGDYPVLERCPIEPRDFVFNELREYMSRRIVKEMLRLQPEILESHTLDLVKMYAEFKNYFLKPWVFRFKDRVGKDFINDSIKSLIRQKVTDDDYAGAVKDANKFLNLLVTLLVEFIGTISIIDGPRRVIIQHSSLLGPYNIVESPVDSNELDRIQHLSDALVGAATVTQQDMSNISVNTKPASRHVIEKPSSITEFMEKLLKDKEIQFGELDEDLDSAELDLFDDKYDGLWDNEVE